jgi:ATP-dependent exoDNAse (exonuclease V) alpha subunit
MPLTLAYARTIHKFQGLSAGPVDEGKIPNPYDCIVCDPDKNEVEGRAVGLFYTAISRATTLGSQDGIGSAIYFTGKDFNELRIRMIGRKKHTDEEMLNIKRRRVWVERIKLYTTKNTLTTNQKQFISNWMTTAKYNFNKIHTRIESYKLNKHTSYAQKSQ